MKDGWETWKDKRRWIRRDNLGRFLKGNFHTSEKHRKSISEARKGWKYSDITKAKISQKLKGIPLTEKLADEVTSPISLP